MGFLQRRGTIRGVPRIRIVVCWGLYCGPPSSGNYHVSKLRPNRQVGEFLDPGYRVVSVGVDCKVLLVCGFEV